MVLPLLGGGVAGCTSDGDGDESSVELPDGCDFFVEVSEDDQTVVQEAFVEVEDGGVVCFGEGEFSFTRQLTLSANDVTLKGDTAATTRLEFSSQISGANGMLIAGDGTVMRDFSVYNTPGDGIRADDVEGVEWDGVEVIWDADESLDNGAYGFYPVLSSHVTIRNSVVKGARDAGIYVGQSTMALVEDNEAYGNVAGIEIENTTDSVVRRNNAHDNTAGILIFNLPGLEVLDGKRANVYENTLENNNTENFAEEGTVVGIVPPGLGMLLLAADDNEIHDNVMRGNRSTGFAEISYLEAYLLSPPNDPNFDVYAEGNFVHDNTYENNGTDPADLVIVLVGGGWDRWPDVMFDGCINPDEDNSDGRLSNCVQEGDTPFVNIDTCMRIGGATDDPSIANNCTQDSLPTELPG